MADKKRELFIAVLSLIVSSSAFIQAQFCGPRIGDYAPKFTAQSTQGTIHFPDDYAGKWIIFFSHPADFTPICATEFKRLAAMFDELASLNTIPVGISVDQAYVHKLWLKDLEKEAKQKIRFPVIADPSMRIAKKYGMIHPHESKTQTVRAVYFIDPQGKVRALFYYPIANGRNLHEIKRLLAALQISDKEGVITPANWQPHEPAIPKKHVHNVT